MRRRLPILSLLAAYFFSGCCGDSVTPVPRPEAYPRIDTYPETYFSLHGMRMNSSAILETDSLLADGSRWITVCYPRYGVRLYITAAAVSPEKMEDAVENRVERMALNSAGQPGELTEFVSSAGVPAKVLVTPRGSAHPVQLIMADDPHGILLTATAVFENPAASANPDSVAPVIEALRRDMIAIVTE